MKTMRFKRLNNTQRGRKALSISSQSKDAESKTYVRKSFVYHVVRTDEDCTEDEVPEINIKKEIDTKTNTERFRFQVRGSFFMTHQRVMIKVNFQHTLNIKIVWKDKIFSPKKSVVLT